MSESQTDQLYGRLRSAILSLELLPGERITERGVESSFGASRTPARAALIRLESDGLVQRLGRGWIVAPIDVDEIVAVSEFRQAVEIAGLNWTAERADRKDLVGLRNWLDAAPMTGDEDDSIRAGSDFHVRLAGLSGNEFVVDAVRSSMVRMARSRWLEVRTPGSRRHAWEEHCAVVDCLLRGDAEEAATQLARHIGTGTDGVLDEIRAHGSAFRARGLSVVGTTPAAGKR